jgi:hypothetical protein
MIAVVIALALAQATTCSPDAAALMKTAAERAAAFDLAGAAQRLQTAVMSGCADAIVPSAYMRGWIAARDAYRLGGSPESLRQVSQSIAILQDTGGKSGPAQIAVLVLQAAAAAAQSERDELALMIDYAVQLEDRNLTAKLPGLPMITAHEAAGELWLQVHRYDDARRAYARAAERVGATPRITLGMARVAARVDALSTACSQYRALVGSWQATGPEPPELSEARTFLANATCQGSVTPRR